MSGVLRSVSQLAVLASAALSLSACAYVSQHPDGTASIVGVAAVSMKQTPGAPPGHVTVRSHGLTLSDKPPAQGLVLGVYDQPMQFGQPKPVTYFPASSDGDIDFVAKTRGQASAPVYDDYRPHKKKKSRKHRRCRCR
jgi:hypothetical protein